MELLRFITCGSVDDGKSTLIGRLLYDCQAVHADLLEQLEENRKRSGAERINLALLTDGLKAEREQGITIDVAYKYFATSKRKFIIADTPGHIQYTRNMVTGASTAQLALLLLDARKGIIEQTRRHAYIAALLGIKHIALCVNKMDLVDYSREAFDTISADFLALTERLELSDAVTIPIAAVDGENIARRSAHMPWYSGPTVVEHLENTPIDQDENLVDVRLPVQYVIRPNRDEHHDYRGYAGRVASGVLRRGDEVLALPSGRRSRIKAIDLYDRELDEAFAPMSVAIRLEDDVDVSRGDMLVAVDNPPRVEREFQARLCWMAESPLQAGQKFLLQHTTRRVRALVQGIESRVNIHNLADEPGPGELFLNDLGVVTIKTSEPIFFDPYLQNPRTGAFILIDEGTNGAVAAGMIQAAP